MPTKSEQRVKQSLKAFRDRWNDSDAAPSDKHKSSEYFGDGEPPKYSGDEGRRRKMKGFGLSACLIIALLLLAFVLYRYSTSKKEANRIAQEQVVDTISVERVQIPAESERGRQRYQREQEVVPATNTKPEVKPVEEKVEAPVTTPVQEEVKVEESKPTPTKPTNSKVQELEEWLASHPEPQMPRGSTNKADWDKYSNDHYEWALKNSEYQGRLKGEIND